MPNASSVTYRWYRDSGSESLWKIEPPQLETFGDTPYPDGPAGSGFSARCWQWSPVQLEVHEQRPLRQSPFSEQLALLVHGPVGNSECHGAGGGGGGGGG